MERYEDFKKAGMILRDCFHGVDQDVKAYGYKLDRIMERLTALEQRLDELEAVLATIGGGNSDE